jgi:hypothetical protein
MLTVALDSERGQLERYLATHHLAWPVIWVGNAEGKPVADLRVASPATVFVIDAEGIMRYRGPGGPAVDYWLEKLTR